MANKDDKKDAPAEKAEVPAEEAAAKAKKRKLLIIIVGGVIGTAGIGAGLAFFLAGGKSEQAAKSTGDAHEETAAHDEKAEAGHGEAKSEEGHGEAKKEDGHGGGHEEAKQEEGHGGGEHGEGKKDEGTKVASKTDGVDFGCTQAFTPFHLNLGNPLENRYIRLEVAVEYGCAEETKAEIEKRLPQLRDAVISVTSRKTREFLLGPDGKEQLRKEIHTRINHYMSRKVDDVFITDILIE
jgi:flagellar FliL protein